MARRKNSPTESKYHARLSKEGGAIPKELLATLIKQKYHLAGGHSAAKICHWAASSLTGGAKCYKHQFYGIESHRCIQSTPVLLFCNHACRFCWRIMPEKKLQQLPSKGFIWDEPGKVAEGLIAAQKEIVSGFGGNPKVEKGLFKEAQQPRQVALSLTGEPTMYPHLERLFREFRSRGMTTFLVTNGTFPERIEKWKAFPTQLYVSMVAPDEEVYKRHIRPASPLLWKKYLRTLSLLPAIGRKCRTVLRMTITRGVNDSGLEGYASQIVLAKPHYVEVKSMVYGGGARQPGRGLSLSSMLSMEEVESIAGRLSQMTGYIVSEKHAPSRIVLLCRGKEAEKNRLITG
ncbi:S-adenosyl-L-methionine-dependent tRNA 4-demethylwyosine synthase [uncultured archaeon]|nr:S-adenosyl-L-methionine-dependent tRNA 4-demethylwyosine synthase [uncultured archaeon]